MKTMINNEKSRYHGPMQHYHSEIREQTGHIEKDYTIPDMAL